MSTTHDLDRSLFFIKPDGVARRLIGEIVGRFERKGIRIVAMKMARIPEETARRHYAAHEGKYFYEPLVRYVISGPVVAMVLEGKNVIEIVRAMLGRTFGSEAAPGTIRGDLAISNRLNLVHASDSPEAAAREIPIFFEEGDLMPAPAEAELAWIYDTSDGEVV